MTDDLKPVGQRRWLYFSGLRYDALYRQDDWLREFLDQPSARGTLFRWRVGTLAVIAVVVSAGFALRLGWLFGLVLAAVALLIVGTVIWRAVPTMIERERASFGQPPFDPSTARIWRRRRPDH